MLGERNVVYVVFIYRIRILRIFRKLRILKTLNFLNLLTYILIAVNKTTIRITDYFSTDYADLPNYLITSSPHFHGLSTDVLFYVFGPLSSRPQRFENLSRTAEC